MTAVGGLLAGAIIFGYSDDPVVEKNAVEAAPPVDPNIQAIARCHKAVSGGPDLYETTSGAEILIPRGLVIAAQIECSVGFDLTGGGYRIIPPNNVKVRVTESSPAAPNLWRAQATR